MELPGLHNSVETGYRKDGYYSLSFFGENGLTMKEIIAQAQVAYPGALRNGKVRLTTVADFVHKTGQMPYRKGRRPHLEFRFATKPTDDELLEIEGIFGPVLDNPFAGDTLRLGRDR
jgi:hypothetical protein